MPNVVDVAQAKALVASGELDVVDVREPHEFDGGHIPGARNVPLAELTADPRGKLRDRRVLFVCARGPRSMTAAKAAESAGRSDVLTLEGGTAAWRDAGLAIETSPDPSSSAPRSRADEGTLPVGGPPGDPGCGLPEPALDAVVGANLRALREARGLSLDAMTQLTGLSRQLLGQIELGRAAPSVSVVWRLARAFDVPFSALISTHQAAQTSVTRAASAKRLVSPDGRFSSRALYDLSEKTNVEFYELDLAGHSREDAQPHAPGTRENLVVTTGRLELEVDGQRFELATGDAIAFTADRPHSYVNPGSEHCRMYLVMTYAAGG